MNNFDKTFFKSLMNKFDNVVKMCILKKIHYPDMSQAILGLGRKYWELSNTDIFKEKYVREYSLETWLSMFDVWMGFHFCDFTTMIDKWLDPIIDEYGAFEVCIDINDSGRNTIFFRWLDILRVENEKIFDMVLNDKRVDPTYENNLCFRLYAQNGNVEGVKYMLRDKRINPYDADNYAIKMARRFKCNDIVDILEKLY